MRQSQSIAGVKGLSYVLMPTSIKHCENVKMVRVQPEHEDHYVIGQLVGTRGRF